MLGEFFDVHYSLGCWPKSMLEPRLGIEQRGSLFLSSAFLFRVGLASMTFDQIRPLRVLIADYFFVSSLLLLLCSTDRRLLRSRGSGVLAAAAVILCGTLLSGVNATSAQIFVLFGLFAPLAIAHAENARKNMLFLVGGITASCATAILAAWVWPGIADVLTINPIWVMAEFGDRSGGLAGHPMILGLSAALAVLIAVGLLSFEKQPYVRWSLFLSILVCTIGALLSGSRNFLASLIPALLILTVWRPLNRRLVAQVCIGLVSLLFAGACINYLAPDLTEWYMARLSQTSADDPENSGRIVMAAVALTEIAQKPIRGWGMDHFGEAGTVYLREAAGFYPAHVNFLQYWYALGILGAMGYLMLFVLPVRRMLKSLKEMPSEDLEKILKLGISVYILLFIASSLQPILLNRFLYMPLFLFAGLAARIPDPSRMRRSKKPSRKQLSNHTLLRPAMPPGEANSTGGA
jgi:O-antigen ligase